ncbi:MAG TPA: hypothetical protein EYP28_03810 [Methanophagales archaeon]|nr:hypothetical protein [Methanophagales archaeon]
MKKDLLKRIAVLGITAVMIVTISLVLASHGIDDKFVGVAPELKKINYDYDSVPPVPIEQSASVINHWGTISVVEGVEQQIFELQGSYVPYSNLWITIYCTSGEINVTTPYKKEEIRVSATQSTTIHSTLLQSVKVIGTGKGYYKISHCCKQHKIESTLIPGVLVPVPGE